jgi:hypothetical protein
VRQKNLFPDFKADTYQNGEKIPTALDLMTQEGITFEYITDPERAKKSL